MPRGAHNWKKIDFISGLYKFFVHTMWQLVVFSCSGIEWSCAQVQFLRGVSWFALHRLWILRYIMRLVVLVRPAFLWMIRFGVVGSVWLGVNARYDVTIRLARVAIYDTLSIICCFIQCTCIWMHTVVRHLLYERGFENQVLD